MLTDIDQRHSHLIYYHHISNSGVDNGRIKSKTTDDDDDDDDDDDNNNNNDNDDDDGDDYLYLIF